MPTYSFKCDACEAEVDMLLNMGETKRKCPECGKLKLKKQFTCPNFHDTYSPMHPRRGRGVGGYGRIEPGQGMQDLGLD